jgi:hypothetical protein
VGVAQQFLITNEVDPLFQEKGEVVINNEEGPCAKAEPDLPCSNTLDSLLGGKRLRVIGETKTRARWRVIFSEVLDDDQRA